jgi:hypothetical protein
MADRILLATVSFVAVEPHKTDLLTCEGGPNGGHQGATVRVLVDGEWEGHASCDDLNHAIEATRNALRYQATEVFQSGGSGTAETQP